MVLDPDSRPSYVKSVLGKDPLRLIVTVLLRCTTKPLVIQKSQVFVDAYRDRLETQFYKRRQYHLPRKVCVKDRQICLKVYRRRPKELFISRLFRWSRKRGRITNFNSLHGDIRFFFIQNLSER